MFSLIKIEVGSFLLRSQVRRNLLLYFLVSRNTFSTKKLAIKY